MSGNDQPEPYSLFSPVTQMFLIFLAQNVGYNEEINLIHSKLDAEEMQTTRMLVNAHIDPGILFKERGDTERSIEHLETALKLTKKCDGESSFREGEIADHLGMLYASRSDFASAKLHYSTAYSVYEKTIGRDDLTTSDCAFRLGGVLEALQSNLASDFYKESLRVHRLNMAEDNERVGDILCCLARLFLGSESHQDASSLPPLSTPQPSSASSEERGGSTHRKAPAAEADSGCRAGVKRLLLHLQWPCHWRCAHREE